MNKYERTKEKTETGLNKHKRASKQPTNHPRKKNSKLIERIIEKSIYSFLFRGKKSSKTKHHFASKRKKSSDSLFTIWFVLVTRSWTKDAFKCTGMRIEKENITDAQLDDMSWKFIASFVTIIFLMFPLLCLAHG